MKYPAGISGAEYAAMENGYEQGLEAARAEQAELTDRLDRLTQLLDEAYELIDDATFHGVDRGLARSWGQRRRRFKDAVIEIREGL